MSEIKTIDDLIKAIYKKIEYYTYKESCSGIDYTPEKVAYKECMKLAKELKANAEEHNR